jgi:hypothetical protein
LDASVARVRSLAEALAAATAVENAVIEFDHYAGDIFAGMPRATTS